MGELRRGGRSSSPKAFIFGIDAAPAAVAVAVVVMGVDVEVDLAYDDAVGGREMY